MLARKFSSLGRMRCPRACLARNATLRPSSVPHTYASDGAPKGVFTRTSLTLLNPGIEYSPLPPMIPISACANHPPEDSSHQHGTRDYTRLDSWPLALPTRSEATTLTEAESGRTLCEPLQFHHADR